MKSRNCRSMVSSASPAVLVPGRLRAATSQRVATAISTNKSFSTQFGFFERSSIELRFFHARFMRVLRCAGMAVAQLGRRRFGACGTYKIYMIVCLHAPGAHPLVSVRAGDKKYEKSPATAFFCLKKLGAGDILYNTSEVSGGLIAQSAEHRPFKAVVPGSSPGQPTTFFSTRCKKPGFFEKKVVSEVAKLTDEVIL